MSLNACSSARLAVLLLYLFVLPAAAQGTLTGKVIKVTDGDTINVAVSENQIARIRLAGIDAPELKQAFGQEAQEALAQFVDGQTVTVRWQKSSDGYGRYVGKVIVADVDVGLKLIERGLAWHYKRYENEQDPGDRALYALAEASARHKSIGLWSEARALAPWDWRGSRESSRARTQEGKSMETMDAFKTGHPLIDLMLQVLLIGVSAAAVWFVFSALLALLYAALKDWLIRASTYFEGLARLLLAYGNTVWQRACEALETFIRQLSLKWVFLEQDAIVGAHLVRVRESVVAVGRQIELGLSDVRTSVESFRGAVDALSAPTQSFESTIGQGTADQTREAARSRRTALVVLIFVTPILLALVALNTAMLTKFFESFIDEWLSYSWGIKTSSVLALFLSVLEIALGVLLYQISRAKDSRSILPALMQLLFVSLILLLALIETYLYYRLSLEMTSERGGSPVSDGLPTWIHAGWLAPFGPVLVISLSALGHVLISAINQYVDAGLQKSQQRLLDEMRQTWTSLMQSGEQLKRRVTEVKTQCGEFIESLTRENDPSSAAGVVEQSLKRLKEAADEAKRNRLNPYASVEGAEARRTFAVLTLKAASLVVLTLFFCLVQFLYAPADTFASTPIVLTAAAFVQAAAVLIASFKIRTPVVLLLEGRPAEVLHGSGEAWSAAMAGFCFVAVVAYNAALGGVFGGEAFQWIPFLLAIVCIVAFALIGRTLPAVSATAKLWMQVGTTAAFALLVWTAAFFCWLVRLACNTIRALLYVLAYPFILVFWRKRLDSSEQASIERL